MSQNPFSLKVKIYTWSAVILIGIALLLRIANFTFAFDPEVGYFDPFPTHVAYGAILIMTVLWLLTSLIFIPQYSFTIDIRPETGRASRVCALVCAAVSAATSLFFFECSTYYAHHAKLYVLTALFSLLAAIYFALRFIGDTSPEHHVLSGYLLLVWLGMILAATYLNLYVQMNSPFKITFHFALAAMMFHVFEDVRMLVKKRFRIAYYAYTLIAVLLCGMASVPVLFAYAIGAWHEPDYLLYGTLSLSFTCYLCARAHDTYKLLMKTPVATEEEIAADREKKRLEKEKQKQKKKKKGADAQKTQGTENSKEGDDKHVS
ncbi:MAG: hypothetical protein IJW99_00400 [Clostridia bacterium]|nr:hypothetical protein [Clostridia bacterium]